MNPNCYRISKYHLSINSYTSEEQTYCLLSSGARGWSHKDWHLQNFVALASAGWLTPAVSFALAPDRGKKLWSHPRSRSYPGYFLWPRPRPGVFPPLIFWDPVPSQGQNPSNIFDPDPGRCLTPADFFDPDPGWGWPPAGVNATRAGGSQG